MKCLFVTEAYPWPPRDGYRMRLANLIEALAEVADVDVVCTERREWAVGDEPDRVRVIRLPEGPQASLLSWLPRWLVAPEPRRVVWRDFEPVRDDLHSRIDDDYDVAVFGHLETYVALGDLVDAPTIVDFDNLENLGMRSQRAVGPDSYPSMGIGARLTALARWLARSAIDMIDERRWDQSQQRVASRVAHVLVCSEIDVERSHCLNAVCVPNGYDEAPGLHPRRCGSLDDARFVFVGSMAYPPNVDAARWYATAVFPQVRAELPNATLRLVGRNPESIRDLERIDGAIVVGQVDDIDVELNAADISVVPIRSGAGTRLKVLEAMAYRLPVASTTLGSEGIALTDGVGAMLRDEPGELAAACVRLAREPELRQSLTDVAFELFETSYRWPAIRRSVGELAREVSLASG